MNKAKLKIQTAIMRKNLLAFEYTDKSSPRSGLRIIEPYLFGADKKGNYFVSGYDTNISLPHDKRHKNYLLQQMNLPGLKRLKDVYTHLQIDPDKIYKTKETIIICVADFPEMIKKIFLIAGVIIMLYSQ